MKVSESRCQRANREQIKRIRRLTQHTHLTTHRRLRMSAWYVSKIVWDTDGEEVEDLIQDCVILPSEEVEEEDIGDWLSDTYGWCVEEFEYRQATDVETVQQQIPSLKEQMKYHIQTSNHLKEENKKLAKGLADQTQKVVLLQDANTKLKQEWEVLNRFCPPSARNNGQAVVDWICKFFTYEDKMYELEKENKKLKEEKEKSGGKIFDHWFRTIRMLLTEEQRDELQGEALIDPETFALGLSCEQYLGRISGYLQERDKWKEQMEQIREYLERFDNDEVEVFDKITEKKFNYIGSSPF